MKELKTEIRKYLSVKLIYLAMSVTPNGKFRDSLNLFVSENIMNL